MSEFFRALAEALSLGNWLARRRASRKDDPENRQRELEKKIDEDILRGDEAAVNERLDDHLARLRMRRRLQDGAGSDPLGPDGATGAGGQ